MRSSETLVLVYLAYLCALAWLRPASGRRPVQVTATAVAVAVVMWWLRTRTGGWSTVVRDWAPGVYLLIGYWLPGVFFTKAMPGLEAWLASGDDVVFRRWGLARLTQNAPRWFLEYLELAYLTVYILVPFGFALVYWGVPGAGEGSYDAYWTLVLASGLVCYGMLPWLQSRPPLGARVYVEIEARGLAIRRLNRRILRSASVQANTLPSGHAATATMVALAAGAMEPGAFLPLAIMAGSICVGAVVGRYHYAIDSALGIAIACTLWITLR